MRKNNIIKHIILSVFAIVSFFSYKNVFAASASISASRTNVTQGEAVSITVSYYAASWNLHVSGSVNDSEVGYNPDGVNQNGSRSWSLNTANPGMYTITLSGDVTDGDTDVNSNVSQSVTVVVNAKQEDPTPPPGPSGPSGPSGPTEPSNPTPSTPQVSPETAGEDTRSGNTTLSKITVENYELNTDDGIHYTLSVPHSVSSIKIDATAEDSKSKVTGTGTKALKVGANEFEIIVTAENGNTKSYYVTITRKATKYPLSDLVGALKESDEVVVVLNDNDVITKSMLEQIQKDQKVIRFVRYKDEDHMLYTWVVDGTKLKNLKDFKTNITFQFDNEGEFDELTGYRKGMYLQFAEKDGFPKGISLKVNVSDHFQKGDNVYVYSYDKRSNLVKMMDGVFHPENGSIEFSVDSVANYFLSKAMIGAGTSGVSGVYKLVAAVEFVILFFLICFLVISKGMKKKKEDSPAPKVTEPPKPEPTETPTPTVQPTN